MVAALVLAVVGCEKPAEDATGGASTNAPAAK